MDRNTIVKIYSMTKPVTGVALMTLWEQEAFDLDDPVTKYIPEFADMQVYTGVDASGEVTVEPAHRPISVRDLTRHTAGFLNNNDVPGLSEMLEKVDTRTPENTLTQMAEKLASIPLWFHPGEQWEYGLCVDMQALIVERISGLPFDQYLRENVLDPLGMAETRYYVPEGDRGRFAAAYRREDGQLNRIPDEEAHSFNFNHWPLKPGGYGLTATIDDYMKFARMLVNKGTLGNETILQPETVELMATNHLSDNVTERSWLPSKGQVGFGIDFAVRLRPPAEDEKYGIVGEYFWDGAASTLFWVDPVNELTAVLFVQLDPFDQIGLHKGFRGAVYSSIKD
jgi:CubicO group peptidase (beta-lactamase class C family)